MVQRSINCLGWNFGTQDQVQVLSSYKEPWLALVAVLSLPAAWAWNIVEGIGVSKIEF